MIKIKKIKEFEKKKKKEKKNEKKKGQAYMIDLILLLLSTIMISLIFIGFLNNVLKEKKDTKNYVEEAANFLILSKGSPLYWETNVSDLQIPGLSVRPNVISNEKLTKLNEMNYTDRLNLYYPIYQTKLTIKNSSNVIYQSGSIVNASRVIVVERLCIINSSPCILRLEVGVKE